MHFLCPEIVGWGGGLPRKGVGVEKFVPSPESMFSLGFEGESLGYPRNFAGMSQTPRGVQKFVQTEFAFFQRATNGGSDPSWLSLAFLGRPDFPSRGPQTL